MNALQSPFSGNSFNWGPVPMNQGANSLQMTPLSGLPTSSWGQDAFCGSNLGLMQNLYTPMFAQGMLLGLELGLMAVMLQGRSGGCRPDSLPRISRPCCHPLRGFPQPPSRCPSLVKVPPARCYPCPAPKPPATSATHNCPPVAPATSRATTSIASTATTSIPVAPTASGQEFGGEKPAPRPIPHPNNQCAPAPAGPIVGQCGNTGNHLEARANGPANVTQITGDGRNSLTALVNGPANVTQITGDGRNSLAALVNGPANVTQITGDGRNSLTALVNGPANVTQITGDGRNSLTALVNGPANVTQITGDGRNSLTALVNGPANVTQIDAGGNSNLSVTLGSGAARVQQNGGGGDDHHQINFSGPNQGSTVQVNGGEGRNSATVSVGQAAVQVYNSLGELMFVSAGEGPSSTVTLENIGQTTYIGSQGQTIGQTALVNGRIINVQTGLPA